MHPHLDLLRGPNAMRQACLSLAFILRLWKNGAKITLFLIYTCVHTHTHKRRAVAKPIKGNQLWNESKTRDIIYNFKVLCGSVTSGGEECRLPFRSHFNRLRDFFFYRSDMQVRSHVIKDIWRRAKMKCEGRLTKIERNKEETRGRQQGRFRPVGESEVVFP